MSTTLHLTLEEYSTMVCAGAFDRIARKVELIRGELIEVNPSGPLHDYLIAYLTTWSARHIDPEFTLITSQTGLDLPDQASRPEPDLMWLRRADFRQSHPLAKDVQLAVEVAYSSLAYDLEDKRRLYAEAGIVEYWIVDALANCMHVFTRPNRGDYQQREIFKVGERLAPSIAPEAILDLKGLFVGP